MSSFYVCVDTKPLLFLSPHERFLCPRCGLQVIKIKKTKEKRYKKSRSHLHRSELPTEKIVTQYDELNNRIETKSTIQRNIHPFRHVSVLSHFVANSIYGKVIKNNNNMRVVIPTNPLINPPISDPNKRTRSDAGKKLIESLRENEKAVFLITNMIPKIVEKYCADPVFLYQFYDFNKEIVSHIEFMTQYWKSAADYRYKRSLVEWNEIIKYANEKGPRRAREKYYGIRPDGTKVKLSIHEIRKKMEEMKDFDQQFKEHYSVFSLAGLVLSEIVASDPELLEEYRTMEQEYHDDDHNDNSKNNNNNDDDEQNNNKKIYSYIYYKAIHSGKKECRIKESEIPSHARKN
jgi:hypothetical protein